MFKWLLTELFTPKVIEVRRVYFSPGVYCKVGGGLTMCSNRYHSRAYYRNSLFGFKWWVTPAGSWSQNMDTSYSLMIKPGVVFSEGCAQSGTYSPRKNK